MQEHLVSKSTFLVLLWRRLELHKQDQFLDLGTCLTHKQAIKNSTCYIAELKHS